MRIYSILLIDIETGEITRTRFLYRKFEAIHFLRRWKSSVGAVAMMWPVDKKIPESIVNLLVDDQLGKVPKISLGKAESSANRWFQLLQSCNDNLCKCARNT